MQIKLGVESLLGIALWVILTAFVFFVSLGAHGGAFSKAALMAIYFPGIDLIIIAVRFIWASQNSLSRVYGQRLIALAIAIKIFVPGVIEYLMQGVYTQHHFLGWVSIWFLLVGILIIKKPFLASAGSPRRAQ